MSRYFTRSPTVEHSSIVAPRADGDWWDAGPMLPPITVPEHSAVNTGLIDHRGDAIMRAPLPIGFGRMDEWS